MKMVRISLRGLHRDGPLSMESQTRWVTQCLEFASPQIPNDTISGTSILKHIEYSPYRTSPTGIMRTRSCWVKGKKLNATFPKASPLFISFAMTQKQQGHKIIIKREQKPANLNRNKLAFIDYIISKIHQAPRKQNNTHSKTANILSWHCLCI